MRNLFRIVLYCCLVFGLSAQAQADNEKRVMLIHSYHPDFSWVGDITQGIRQVLGNTASLSVHYLDTKRIPKSEFSIRSEQTYQTFLIEKPDVVVICDDNGFRLLGNRISETTPVVFCGINGDLRTDYPWAVQRANVTGVVERPLIKRTILQFSKAVGQRLGKVLILLGDSPTAQAFHRSDLGGMRHIRLSPQSRADVLRIGELSKWKQEIAQAKNNGFDLLLLAGFSAMRDGDGQHVDVETLSQWVNENTPLVTITVHEQAIGPGKVAAGMVVSGKTMGQDTAKLVQLILQQGTADSIPILFQNQGRLIFSRSELAKWDLTLPDQRQQQMVVLP